MAKYAPLAPEWAEYLAHPGAEKGCLATEIDFQQESRTFRTEHQMLHAAHVNDYEHEIKAKRDYNRMTRALKHIKLRKSVPSWSIPVELLAMLMLPDRTKTAHERLGVGAAGVKPIAPCFRQVLTHLFYSIRKCARVPMMWNQAVGYQLPKNNGCVGPSSVRLIFGLCTIGKLFFTPMLRENKS